MTIEQPRRNRYEAVILKIFFDNYDPKITEFPFAREDLESAAESLGIRLPKNLGDVIYSFRYRATMPVEIIATQPDGMEWLIEGIGRARYRFRLSKINRIVPNPNLLTTKIPNATPEIISSYSLSDEQALLAIVRYNRLIDVFLGIASYSLQNHLRTTVSNIGQIEIDEVYVGLDTKGRQYVIPVQAKGGTDQLSAVQTQQDLACCAEKFPHLICRAVSTQFITNELIAMFELVLVEDDLRIVREQHYQLVQSTDISEAEVQSLNCQP